MPPTPSAPSVCKARASGVVAAAKADGKLQFSFNATDSAFEIVPQTFTWELASTDNIAIVQQNFLDLMAECRIEHLYLLHNPLGENENIPTYAQALKLEATTLSSAM